MGLTKKAIFMTTKKVFVDENDEALVVCPQCGKTKRVNISSFKDKNIRNLQAKCPCGSLFPISLEFRRFHRRETSLDGRYMNLSGGNEGGKMRVVNLSLGGIGLIDLSFCHFKVGDRVNLSFSLEDKRKSEIDIIGVVKHMTDRYLGCDLENTHRISPH
jgi:hypothetical protein